MYTRIITSKISGAEIRNHNTAIILCSEVRINIQNENVFTKKNPNSVYLKLKTRKLAEIIKCKMFQFEKMLNHSRLILY